MKKLCTALFASMMLVAFSAPAWANGASDTQKQCSTKNTASRGHHHKLDNHKHKVLKQYKKLKKTYNKTTEDARQMFLEYLGSNQPCPDTNVSAIREEYEQQIAQLNETIASQEQQIAGLNTTIASQQQQITDLSTTLASQQQQLTELNATIASQQQQLVEANDTIAALQGQIDTAYNNGMTAGMQTCATVEPARDPQLSDSWGTGNYYPHALDVDNNGNTYIVERSSRSVVGYDSTGAQIAQWTSASLGTPVDLATDSQGNIFILDRSAPEFLQKYTPSGQPMPFISGSTDVSRPLGLFIDSQDNVYITDMGGEFGGRILIFDSTGAQTATFGEVSDLDLYGDEYCDIAVDEANQKIYIVTHYNHMVAKFGMDGTYEGAWQGDCRNPNSIAIGAQGQIFVADTDNNQVDQYDADGTLTYTISSDQLYRPTRIVVDNAGKLFVALEFYQSVQVYQ